MAGKVILLAVCFIVTKPIDCLPSHPPGSRAVTPTPTEPYPQYSQLDADGNVHLYWKFNSTHITFEAHVKTRGYVGLGLSHNGNMYPADIVIGWVKHGHTFFQVGFYVKQCVKNPIKYQLVHSFSYGVGLTNDTYMYHQISVQFK